MKATISKVLFLLIAIILCVSSSLYAQNNAMLSRNHEVRLHVGIAPLYTIGHSIHDHNNIYYWKQTFVPSLNLSYSYQFKKWLSFGASMSYSGTYLNKYDNKANELFSKDKNHYFSLTPSVRFDWYRADIVKLHSAVGLGLCLNTEDYSVQNSYGKFRYSYIPSFDITFIGITIGRKVFGLCELGLGTSGLIKFGVGYRFKGK